MAPSFNAPARRRRAKPDLPHGRACVTVLPATTPAAFCRKTPPMNPCKRPPEVGLAPSAPIEVIS